MLRRTIILAVLAVLLGASSGDAGDVKTKTWTVTTDTVGQVAYTSIVGVTGYRYFTLSIEWESGLDTADLNTHQWIVETEADDGVTRWRNAYVDDTVKVGDVDSASYPLVLKWDGRDSTTFSRLRVRFESDVDDSGNEGDAVHTSVSVLKLHLIATKH